MIDSLHTAQLDRFRLSHPLLGLGVRGKLGPEADSRPTDGHVIRRRVVVSNTSVQCSRADGGPSASSARRNTVGDDPREGRVQAACAQTDRK